MSCTPLTSLRTHWSRSSEREKPVLQTKCRLASVIFAVLDDVRLLSQRTQEIFKSRCLGVNTELLWKTRDRCAKRRMSVRCLRQLPTFQPKSVPQAERPKRLPHLPAISKRFLALPLVNMSTIVLPFAESFSFV